MPFDIELAMHVAQLVLKGGLDGKSYIPSERWEEV
jgi:hypothetical protein